jgi:hypothetical protein
MASNPLVTQGVLNRALTSVSVVDFPDLNVTSGFFGTKVARIAFEGDASDYLATLTGAVPSPRLFQLVSISMYLNKSQGLAALWEQQRLTNTTIGDINVVTDSPVLPAYYFYNCTFMNVPDLDLTGESNDYPVMLKGTYPVNASLFG